VEGKKRKSARENLKSTKGEAELTRVIGKDGAGFTCWVQGPVVIIIRRKGMRKEGSYS